MKPSVSSAFQAFVEQAPEESKAWMQMVETLSAGTDLDRKTRSLCYLSVLAAARLTTGIPFHASQARVLGATREEVVGAVLVGLPAVGNVVIESLPAALAAFDTTREPG